MILGIDPKNDFAFHCLFGSEHHTSVLVHLLNAVLRPPPEHRVVSVQILNPITEPVKLDDKLAILDIKARDQSGRYFNIEMQMVLHPALESRFLYYWARGYSSQLISGDQYERLAPVISICFLDGLLFPETDAHHLQFRLRDEGTGITFSDHLSVHLIQLPNFLKTEDDLGSELDVWLYLLNNGKVLDPDRLVERLQFPEFLEALSILKTLTQDDILREQYEAREKARRDALSWKSAIERSKQEAERIQQEAERIQQEAERSKQEAERSQQEVERLRQEVVRSHDRGLSEGLVSQIQLCEEVLNRPSTPEDQLKGMTVQELQQMAARLRQEVTGQEVSENGSSTS